MLLNRSKLFKFNDVLNVINCPSIIGPGNEIQEVTNAYAAYDK